MSTHEPAGRSVCIHAVCVRAEHQRKGIAVALLHEYLRRLTAANAVRAAPAYERVLLITHEELRPLYERAGFAWLGKSDVVHGSKPWFEMRWDAPATPPQQQQQIPAGLWDALQSSSSKKRPEGKQLSEFAGVEGVALVDEKAGQTLNAFDLLCPRAGCGSVILKKGNATLEERESVQVDLRAQHWGESRLIDAPDGPAREPQSTPHRAARTSRKDALLARRPEPDGVRKHRLLARCPRARYVWFVHDASIPRLIPMPAYSWR
jgi:hypothetical protein